MRGGFVRRPSNYDQMRDQMAREILRRDLRPAIRRFALRTDAGFLYLRFIGQDYRVSLKTGLPESSRDGFQTVRLAGYNEAMTIYDILGDSKPDCRLSGRFVAVNALPGVVQSASLGGDLFAGAAKFFDGRMEALRSDCEALGGIPFGVGDVAYRLPLFDFLPVVLQFWASDDEFPPVVKFLWDENTLDFLHYETTWFAAGALLARLESLCG